MKSNLKVILSAVGVVALLASPALAKTRHHHVASPYAVQQIPYDARASVVEPYAASLPERALPPISNNLNPDFQLGGER